MKIYLKKSVLVSSYPTKLHQPRNITTTDVNDFYCLRFLLNVVDCKHNELHELHWFLLDLRYICQLI